MLPLQARRKVLRFASEGDGRWRGDLLLWVPHLRILKVGPCLCPYSYGARPSGAEAITKQRSEALAFPLPTYRSNTLVSSAENRSSSSNNSGELTRVFER